MKAMKILGVDIGGTSIKLCRSDAAGQIDLFEEYDSDAKKGGPHLFERVSSIIENHNGFDAIGISTAGQVNPADGSILYANENIPNYTGMKVKALLEERFQVPVKVENDVNAAALGEKYFGAGKEWNDFICLTYGTGIGGAIIIDSGIYGGKSGIAGEMGHMITHPYGLDCNCGKQGCYEMYASTTALIREARSINPNMTDGRTIFTLYKQKNAGMAGVVERWIEEVVLGLVTLVHIFNPPAIILGGGVMEQETILEKIEERLKDMVMVSFSDVKIRRAALGNKAGALGAASLHLLSSAKE